MRVIRLHVARYQSVANKSKANVQCINRSANCNCLFNPGIQDHDRDEEKGKGKLSELIVSTLLNTVNFSYNNKLC